MNRPTLTTTFYSFKGGVGRTLLLANVGAYLALNGRRVLLWDLDVEAPGMHLIPALFPDSPPLVGFLEWMRDWQEKHRMKPPGERLLSGLSDRIYPVPRIKGLDLLPAFGDKADAAGLYQDIHWHRFLVEKPEAGLGLLRAILDHLGRHGSYDHILLDARTGITDLGGFMTAVLPHVAVLVGSYGAQNLSGLLRIYRALQTAADGRLAPRAEKALPPLKRLVVVSPVPQGQESLRGARREVWDREFPLGKEATRVEIPFDGRLLFTEDLLCLSDPGSAAAGRYIEVALQVDGFLEDLERSRQAEQEAAAAYPDQPGKEPLEKDRRTKGQTFEDQTARLLALLDYRVEREQIVDGHPVDLVALKERGLRGECYLVECKASDRPVGKGIVERLHSLLQGEKARQMRAEGMVVAQQFTPAALTFAKSVGILTHTPRDLENALFDFGPYLSRLMRTFEESELARTYVPQRVLVEEGPTGCRESDLLDRALDWAGGSGQRLWLLLGDYGTGKTSFFRRFAYEMARRYREAANSDIPKPVPLAVDLKEFPNAIHLKGLVQEHLREYAGWHGNPEIIFHLMAAGRVVLLLDAFDEMGTAAAGRSVEEQFRMLARPTQDAGEVAGNRVLITCRTHFFRDQQYVKDVCNGSVDDLIRRDSPLGQVARSFNAAVDELLLFNDDQIRLFLEKHLSKSDASRAADFIRDTYDLPSLAPRPVLLEMIVKALPEMMRSGAGLTPAGLYHWYTSHWLADRSGNSLLTTPEQRKRLLERLAFELWSRPQNLIHHRQLIQILESVPHQHLAGLDLDRVDLELRTAAFLIRNAEGYYGFSHRSFMEFFLAHHLMRATGRKRGLAPALPTLPLTPETCDFLADMAESDAGRRRVFEQIRAILEGPYAKGASENALRLAYRLSRKTAAAGPDPTQEPDMLRGPVNLAGAVLKEEAFPGIRLPRARLRRADLSGSDLSGADLSGADFSAAELTGCRLDGAAAAAADFSGTAMRGIHAAGADFSGARFAKADLTGAMMVETACEKADFTGALCAGARFAAAKLAGARWDGADTTRMTSPGAEPCIASKAYPESPIPLLQLGHQGPVNRAVYSADGKQVLTASSDNTARIWDAASGKEIRRFEGHGAMVRSAVYSADGKQVLTASSDNTARIWDAASGKEIRRFEGHGDWVRSAVYSADGKQVLTASDDNTARIWDAASGKEIRRFEGHGARVLSAVYSADGKQVLTASDDNTARIWDAASGKEIRRFEGHGARVWSAVYSADGKQVLTASDDKTARIWDAASGKEIRRFEGHGARVLSAVYSADGKQVLTASDDNTARIWDAASGKEIRRFEGHGDWVWSAVYSADGKQVLTASDDKTARIWDAASGKEIRRFEGHGARVWSAVYSADGKAGSYGK